MKSPLFKLIINLGLLFSGLMMAFSGLLIQIKFHMGNHGMMDPNKEAWSLNHTQWLLIHKIAVLVFTLIVIYHIILHKKWFKAVITKKMMGRNKLVMAMSFVLLLVALTGYASWFIRTIGSDRLWNMDLISVHDRIGLLLIVLFAMHIYKRFKWFNSAMRKVKRNT